LFLVSFSAIIVPEIERMKDKVVIITGASSGIGKALAFKFGELGSKVVLAARNTENLQAVNKELIGHGIETLVVQADVSIESDCKKIINNTVEKFGKIDILINNAGISMRAIFADLDLSVIRKLMDVNFWGTVFCTKYALPYLLESKGSVVGVISVAGHIGLPARSGYSASKFAVRGFLDTLRCETQKTGLHVMVVAPGFTESNIRKAALKADGSSQAETPRDESKMMTSAEVAEKVYNGVIRRKRSMVLTFLEGKFTVFLNKWFPSLVDKLAYSHMAKEPDSPLK
jgi:short-subunit dehydrogenase